MGVMKESGKNEDNMTTTAELKNSVLSAFVGVYDGHSGAVCSDFVNQLIEEKILAAFPDEEAWDNGESIVLEVFHQVEEEFMRYAKEKNEPSGSCATVVLVKDNQALVANIGTLPVLHAC